MDRTYYDQTKSLATGNFSGKQNLEYYNNYQSQYGTDAPSLLVNAYLNKQNLSTTRDTVDLLSKYGFSTTRDTVYNDLRNLDTNKELANKILQGIGLIEPEQLDEFKQIVTTPGTGVTAEMRRNDPEAAAEQYAKIDAQIEQQQQQREAAEDGLAPAPQAQTMAPVFTRNLSVGSQGDDVIQLQRALGITSDGIFGPKTQAAVRAFQQSKGLQVDGIVGPKTFASLYGTSGGARGGQSTLSTVSSGAQSNSGGRTSASSGAGAINQTTQTMGNDVSSILKNEFGIDLSKKSPMTGFADIYEQVYKDSGLTTVKKQIEDWNKEYETLQNKKSDEAQAINNNPWLSEGVRVSELRKLDEKYEARETNLTKRLEMAQSMYDAGRDDAQFIAGKIYDQAKGQQDLLADFVLKAVEIAEKRSEAAAKIDDDLLSPTEAASLGVPYGTTKSQAAKMGIIPDRYKPTETINGLTGPQLTAFNSLADKQNKSPLIAALDRTIVLKNTIQAIKANPGDSAQQLNLAYAYIQALDTYQSAVREGELGNLNSIDSKIGAFQNNIQRLTNGQTVRPEVAIQIADAANSIIKAIEQGAVAKKQQFAQQAQVQGLGDIWSQYMGGSTGGTIPTTNNSNGSVWDSW